MKIVQFLNTFSFVFTNKNRMDIFKIMEKISATKSWKKVKTFPVLNRVIYNPGSLNLSFALAMC